MHTSHVPAEGLHPLEGFTTVITDKVFPLSVDRLVSVQSARCDESLPAYFTPVRPLSCVCPDVSCQVGAVTEALFADGAAVGLLFALLAGSAVAAVVVVGVEGQGGVLQAAPQTGRRRDEVFDVRFQAFQLLRVVAHPEIPVALLLLLLHLRGLWVLLLHAAAPILLTVMGLRSLHCRD